MERRTAPPPADGRPLQLGNGGLNKALMPLKQPVCPPINVEGGEKVEKEQPGALLARRTRTIRMCSSDARSRGQPWQLPPVLGRRTGEEDNGGRPDFLRSDHNGLKIYFNRPIDLLKTRAICSLIKERSQVS